MSRIKVSESVFPSTQVELMACVNNHWKPLTWDSPTKGPATSYLITTQAPMLTGLMRSAFSKAGAPKVTRALNGSILLGRVLQSGARTASQGIAVALEMFMTDDSTVIETAAVLICDMLEIPVSVSLEIRPDTFIKLLEKNHSWFGDEMFGAILSSRKLNTDSKAISTKAVA